MDSSQNGGKMLIPSRPYNANMPQSVGIGVTEEVKEEYKAPKPAVAGNKKDIQINNGKIKLPPRGYNEPTIIQQKEPNGEKSSFLEIQSNFKLMRNAIKNKIKNAMIEARLELTRLDDIENNILSTFFQANYPQNRVKTDIDSFFSEIEAEMFLNSPAPVDPYDKKPNISLNFTKTPEKIQSSPANFKPPTNNPSGPASAAKVYVKVKNMPQASHSEMNSSFGSIGSGISNQNLDHESRALLICFQNTETLYSDDCASVKSLKIPFITKGMGILIMNGNQVLIAGGPNDVSFIYSIDQKGVRHLPKLVVKKRYFGMSFIGKNPAIFGGLSPSQQILHNVEMFNGKEWESVSPMIISRSHCHATTHGDYTYVFGGISVGVCTSIERYLASWELLNVQIPSIIRNFGLISYKNDIILFGGDSDNKSIRNVIKFQVNPQNFVGIGKLSQSFSTNTNSTLTLRDNKAYLLDADRRNIIEFIIK